jgi:hypothetical protein
VTRLPEGQPVQVKFSLAGEAQPCFLVSATVDGKELNGYVKGSALAGAEEFERDRKAARSVEVSAPPRDSSGAPSSSGRPLKITVSAKSATEIDRVNQLLAKNQNQQALEVVEKLLLIHPREPGLLALAGMAAHRADQMQRALQFYKESLDIKQDPLVEQMYNEARREADLDKSGQRTYGTRFVLRYDGAVADGDMARAVVGVLEEEFSRIQLQLGCRTDDRIVTIVQTREAYARITGSPEWSGAAYDGKIHVPLVARSQITAEMRQTFAHELVHACISNTGQWPSWLHEGLAQKLAGQALPPGVKQQIQALAKAGKLPTLAQMGNGWGGLSTQQAMLAYSMSLVAIDLFFEHHSGLGIRNLMQNPDQLPRITADLDRRLRE